MVSRTLNLDRNEKALLLQDFYGVANELTPSVGLASGLKSTLRTWLCLKLTVVIQTWGYNRRKIEQWQAQGKEIIINIGCLGEYGKSDYLNADLLLGINYLPKVFLGQLDYDLLLNLTECDRNILNLADGIFLSHVLEHIPPNLALEALKNCLAYLKVGAGLRVVVPDIEKVSFPQLPTPSTSIRRTLDVNRGFYGWGHKFMYNLDLVTLLMEEAGFKEVKAVEFRSGFLGNTDLEKYKNESLYVTGFKA